MIKKNTLNYNKLLAQSEKCLAKKQYQKAISFAKQANKLKPEEERPNEIIVSCYVKLNKPMLSSKYDDNLYYIRNYPSGYRDDPIRAFKQAQKSIDNTSNSTEKFALLKKLGNGYVSSYKYSRALRCYLDAEAIDQTDEILLRTIGGLYERIFSQLGKAVEYYKKAFLLGKTYLEEKAQNLPREFGEKTSFKRDDERIFNLCIKIGKYEDAIEIYKDAIKKYPNEDILFQNIAEFYLKLYTKYKSSRHSEEVNGLLDKKIEEAIRFYTKAYKRYPKREVILKGVAFFNLLNRKFFKAIKIYKQINKIHIGWLNSFFEETKNYADAVDFYNSLIEVLPDRFDLYFELTYWSIHAGQHLNVKYFFLKYYSIKLKENSDYLTQSKEEVYKIYEAYCKLEYFSEGIQTFLEIEKEIESKDDKVYLKSFVGKFQYKAKQYADSVKTIGSILNEEDIPWIYFFEYDHPIRTLRKAYLAENKYEEAIQAHEKFLKNTKKNKIPNHWTDNALYSLGDLYFEKKDYKNAIRAYLKSVKSHLTKNVLNSLLKTCNKIKKTKSWTKLFHKITVALFEARKIKHSYSFLNKAFSIKNNDWTLLELFEEINRYNNESKPEVDLKTFPKALKHYEWVLKDANDAIRIYAIAKLKKEFHKTEEAIQELKLSIRKLESPNKELKKSLTVKKKKAVEIYKIKDLFPKKLSKLLEEIYEEQISFNEDAKKYFKDSKKLSRNSNYEGYFLQEEKHQENINTLEYQIFLETYFGDALNESSVRRIAYPETMRETKNAICHIIDEIESLEDKIKTCKESELLSILLFLAFLNQRLLLLAKNDKLDIDKQLLNQKVLLKHDKLYKRQWIAFMQSQAAFIYNRFNMKPKKIVEYLFTKINEAEQKWKEYFLELTAKYPEELFDFQRKQIRIQEEVSKRMQRSENAIRSKISNFDKLEDESKKLLITAEYIYKNLDASPEDSDYSSVVAHYGRAIENELIKKLHLVWDEKYDHSLNKYRQNLIKGILTNDPKLAKYIDKNELTKKRRINIFSEEYLGFSLNPKPEKKNWSEGVFQKNIQNERNAASHSGKDSFFDRAKADKVIKDMTDFLLEWTEVNFKKPNEPNEK